MLGKSPLHFWLQIVKLQIIHYCRNFKSIGHHVFLLIKQRRKKPNSIQLLLDVYVNMEEDKVDDDTKHRVLSC